MKRSKKLTAGLAVVALGLASPAAAASRTLSAAAPAASTQPAPLSPWVVLSALGSSSSSAAICASAAAASSAVQGAATPGCVLPAVDAPPPIAQAPQGTPVPVAAGPAAAAGFSILPLLLGLAGAAAIAALLLTGGPDEDEIDVEPITQA
uniref:hypothetical protein n=1 Tax=uncultured Sphingomonas sp. TaxID=158754 RepID=UPI0025DFCAB7|nr:hypothetical protein [uncultured Sphingomonas sp.]